MEKIIQIIPAVTDLYAVWKEDNDNGKEYGVNKAYYLGLSRDGEVFPLVIMGDGYIDISSCDGLMVFDWNGYQWWKLYEADLPVNEYFNEFEREQKQDHQLTRIAEELEGINNNLSEIALSLDSLDQTLDGCISRNGNNSFICITGNVSTY